ncbi:MAG: hypothetical protein DDG59_06335 [Anaerolineae bacterium]|jgi:hypothetical protein|nr:MAG: hypothetical protein DDG59_06335 [Anaerolineae bacterium]
MEFFHAKVKSKIESNQQGIPRKACQWQVPTLAKWVQDVHSYSAAMEVWVFKLAKSGKGNEGLGELANSTVHGNELASFYEALPETSRSESVILSIKPIDFEYNTEGLPMRKLPNILST